MLGRWPPDLVAFGLLLALVLGGLVPVEQAFSGFGSPAVVAVAAIFVISAGLERTGAAALVGRPLRLLAGRSTVRLLVTLMAVTGLLSAFMNNLAAVGVLLPVTMAVAYRRRTSPSLLLLPLAYAARFGGNLTLIAGPTNLLLADILSRRGVATLRLFDFLPIGLPMLVVGTAWMATAGWRLLPHRPPEELLRAMRRAGRLVRVYRLSERLFEARIPPGSPLVGKTIEESEFGRAHGLTVVAVVRGRERLAAPPKDLVLHAEDRLVIEGRLDELLQAEAFARLGLELAQDETSLETLEGGMAEAMVAPRSALDGRTLRDVGFRERYGLTVLAVWREGRPIRTRIADIPLRPGDGLLIQGPRRALTALGSDRDLILFDLESAWPDREHRRGYALLAAAALVVLTLAGMPVALAAALAAGIIVLSGGLTMEEAYRAIDWRSLILIGAMIPTGVVMEQTGAASLLAAALIRLMGGNSLGTLAAILLAATAIGHFVPSLILPVVLAPLAIDAASTLHTSALPFAMAIIAATGLGLLTPFSNPVMLMVMAPGGYRLQDYVRAGLPLVLLLLALMLVVLPLAYPF
ncbi:MAG: SLC13 family permease [Armatimonadota bacterium]|nr:SLC13 family permease [Armatimonadota bacterium]